MKPTGFMSELASGKVALICALAVATAVTDVPAAWAPPIMHLQHLRGRKTLFG
jgi:hypothetical protein